MLHFLYVIINLPTYNIPAITPIGASPGIEECEEVRVGSVQMDVQHLYSTSEEGK